MAYGKVISTDRSIYHSFQEFILIRATVSPPVSMSSPNVTEVSLDPVGSNAAEEDGSAAGTERCV